MRIGLTGLLTFRLPATDDRLLGGRQLQIRTEHVSRKEPSPCDHQAQTRTHFTIKTFHISSEDLKEQIILQLVDHKSFVQGDVHDLSVLLVHSRGRRHQRHGLVVPDARQNVQADHQESMHAERCLSKLGLWH